ncbi:MAG: zf-HC2 domain-containing protein, partial [Candidatus Limnocylindrales bacterium]
MSPLSCAEVTDLAPAFVLGALEPAATHDVRDHLASCPEAHAEFEELGGVVPYLAESVEPAEPPAGLAGRITATIDAEVRAGRRTDAAADRLIASLGAGSRGPIPVDVPGAAAPVDAGGTADASLQVDGASRQVASPVASPVAPPVAPRQVAGAPGPADGGVR